MTEPSDSTLRQWLLQRLPPEDSAPLEQRLLEDGAFGDRLREAETDLLDDLARGRLAKDDRAIAEQRFEATARDRERLRIAVALANATSTRAVGDSRVSAVAGSASHGRARRRVLIGAIASAAALAVLVVGVNRQRAVDSAITQTTITLMASQQRGANVEDIGIPRSAGSVRLQVEVDAADADTRYSIDIDAGGRSVFGARDLAPKSAGPYRFVEIVTTAKTLAPGDYHVRVEAQNSGRPASTWSVRTREE